MTLGFPAALNTEDRGGTANKKDVPYRERVGLPTQARAMLGNSTGDDRLHASLSELATVLVVVIAAVGEQAGVRQISRSMSFPYQKAWRR